MGKSEQLKASPQEGVLGGGSDGRANGREQIIGGMPGMGMGGGGGGVPLSLRNLRTFTSFSSPAFRLYYYGMLGQMAAMNMQMVTRGLLIYRLTGSVSILGFMAVISSLPMLFFSLYGGVIADRVQKKYVLLAGLLVVAVSSLGVALTLTLGYLSPQVPGSWWILIVSSVIEGTVMGLMMPSRQAMIPEIVGDDQIMNAISLNMFGMNMLRLLAPALAGFFIDFWGFQAIYYTMTGLYLIAVLFIVLMPQTGVMTIKGRGAIADMVEGFRYIRREASIFLVLAITLFMVLMSMPYMTLLPVFTEDILKVGARGIGVLVSISGIGAMLSSIVLASLPNKKRGLLLLISGIVLGLALIGFSFSGSWAISLVMITFVGLGQTARMTLANTLLQSYTAEEYRGRVMSIYMMEFGLTSLSVVFAALMAGTIGVQWSVGGLAMILVLVSVMALFAMPRLRKLD